MWKHYELEIRLSLYIGIDIYIYIYIYIYIKAEVFSILICITCKIICLTMINNFFLYINMIDLRVFLFNQIFLHKICVLT